MFVDLKLSMCLASNFDLSGTLLVQTKRLFCTAFSKAVTLRVAARFKGAQPLARRFFSIAFLCASAVKEKRLKSLGI
jgi:hypothetical protein